MGTLIMKCVAIASLATAAAVKPSLDIQILLGFVVCAAAIAVAAQAIRSHKYVWAAMFFTIAIMFNPVFTFQSVYARRLEFNVLCGLAFVFSLFVLKKLPKRTIASITGQSPSDSL